MVATFGGRLRRLREEKGLKQTDLAKLLKLESSSTISQYENEALNRIPDAHILQKLADLFNVSIDYLLGRTNTRKETAYIISGTGDEDFGFDKDIPMEVREKIRDYAEYLIRKYKEGN
jgi:transcriptional regulator with XRE-family HTH domain